MPSTRCCFLLPPKAPSRPPPELPRAENSVLSFYLMNDTFMNNQMILVKILLKDIKNIPGSSSPSTAAFASQKRSFPFLYFEFLGFFLGVEEGVCYYCIPPSCFLKPPRILHNFIFFAAGEAPSSKQDPADPWSSPGEETALPKMTKALFFPPFRLRASLPPSLFPSPAPGGDPTSSALLRSPLFSPKFNLTRPLEPREERTEINYVKK